MALYSRQPFAEIGSPRLQALSSAKNRQNAITPSCSSPLKPTQSIGKRRAPAVFDEDDSENVDPSIFNSPSKKSKSIDGFSKPTKFSLVTSPSKASPSSLAASPSIPSVRKALSSPNTTRSTPIGLSRGSPKHKRISAISKRRASSSPFRRIDPPSFSQSSPALPFSIDAALSGTISTYTPKSIVATPSHVPTLEEAMPKSWFFDIHEDTPEQEAANMMEHSAAVLDISSDDDIETKKRNEEMERGKENIPPPDFSVAQPHSPSSMNAADSIEQVGKTPSSHVKLPRLRKIAQDAMDEDRSPLSDLPASDFYGEGLDANSYVTVDATIERPSGLSKEFDFSVPTPEKETPKEKSIEQAPADEAFPIFSDELTTSESIATAQEVAAVDVAVETEDVIVAPAS